MKFRVWSSLPVLLPLIFSGTVAAAPLGSVVQDSASAVIESLVTDSKFKLRYSQFYWKESGEAGYAGNDRDEWVHALRADYSSGYLFDFIGFDYSFGMADDLYIGDNISNTSNLKYNPADPTHPDGLAGTTQAFLKAKVGDEKIGLDMSLGQKQRHRMLLQDSQSRILPSGTVGYDLDAHVGSLKFYYTEIDKQSPRDDDYWGRNLTNFLGQQIDSVQVYGANYSFDNGLYLAAEQAVAEDYLKRQVAKAQYKMPVAEGNLKLELLGAREQDDGDLFEYDGINGFLPETDDHDARYWEAGITYSRDGYYVGLLHSKITGADFNRPLFSRDYGATYRGTDLFYAFSLEDEAMWKLKAGTDFARWGLPGMRWDMHLAYSDGAEGFDGFRRYEAQSVLQYRFSGELDGLSLAWLSVTHDTEGTPDGVNRTFSGYNITQHDANRIYVNYDIKF
ncbi:hypothetical protein GCM10011348_13360 [Marinobacterium nitratireducens]|uniref:Outer membrane porin, OprD family n=1 Tax=Marinobacterium nitratireducens TaxID=518897 RepID=A0A917ZA20_9GAMM|nr:OprD family outer membrane porin [Marinobacterium nitratireducens]GGO79336.1 hypothetical protein GCM10011348_13360 [Marinobacterium nitratireducens]